MATTFRNHYGDKVIKASEMGMWAHLCLVSLGGRLDWCCSVQMKMSDYSDYRSEDWMTLFGDEAQDFFLALEKELCL